MLAIDFQRGFEDAWANIATFVPKLIGFLLVLLIGWFIVKAIAKAVDALLEKTKFDSVVERGSVGKALKKSKFDASDMVAKLVFYALFLLVLQFAFGLFGPNPISDLITSVISYIPKVIVALILIIISGAIAAAVKDIVEAALGSLSYGKTLAIVASSAIVVVGVFAALSQLQVAPAIVNGLFYALLAIIVGSSVIAIGGGGIQAMQQRWKNVLAKYDDEKPHVQQEMQGAQDRIAAKAELRKQQLATATAEPLPPPVR